MLDVDSIGELLCCRPSVLPSFRPSVLPSFRPCLNNVRLTAALAALLFVPVGGANAAGKLAFAQASLDFGGNALGESKTMSATLRNTTAAEIVLGAASIADNPGGYTLVSTTCGATLPAKQNCKYTLRYTASTLQPLPAQLELITQSPAFPKVTLPLQANRYTPLNDTGITRCGNDTQNSLPCPVPDFPRQDAQYSRDRTRNIASNGKAGFNFTKLDAQGKDLPASAKNWDCVRDNVTGLVWERKPLGDGIVGNQGLHDADDRYTWYSTDTSNNGGAKGFVNPKVNGCFGYSDGLSETWCNSEAYVSRVNAAGWCGATNGWRMPTLMELLGLADLSVASSTRPTIDTRYFSDTKSLPYWTSSPGYTNADYAWYVDFDSGLSNYYISRTEGLAVRLVRDGQ